MQSKKLLKISLIVTFIGLFLIIILANCFEPKTTEISSIDKKILDEWVKVTGQVNNLKSISTESGYLTTFTITDSTGRIDVIFYKKINLTEKVEIIGKISEYQGKLQISASKIKILE
jgi:RecJ-like exonuclease